MGMFNKALNQIESSFLNGEKKYLYGAGAITGAVTGGVTYGTSDENRSIKAGVAGAIGVGTGFFGARYGINKSLDKMVDINLSLINSNQGIDHLFKDGLLKNEMSGPDMHDLINKSSYFNVANSRLDFFDSDKVQSLLAKESYNINRATTSDNIMSNFNARVSRRSLPDITGPNVSKLKLRDSIKGGSLKLIESRKLNDAKIAEDMTRTI